MTQIMKGFPLLLLENTVDSHLEAVWQPGACGLKWSIFSGLDFEVRDYIVMSANHRMHVIQNKAAIQFKNATKPGLFTMLIYTGVNCTQSLYQRH